MTKSTGYDLAYEAGEAVHVEVGDIAYLEATAAVTKGTFVKISAGKVAPATAADGVVGIALADIASGKVGRVLINGVGTVTANEAVVPGNLVAPTTAGKAAVAAYGAAASGFVLNTASDVAVVRLMTITKAGA